MAGSSKDSLLSMEGIKIESGLRIPNLGVTRLRPSEFDHQLDRGSLRRRLELVVEAANVRRDALLDRHEVSLDDVFVAVVLVVDLVHLFRRNVDLNNKFRFRFVKS